MIDIAQHWLNEQLSQQRDLLLVLDRLAEPDPLQGLLDAELMQDHINLYQDTEFAELADIGPWLVRVKNTGHAFFRGLLEAPQQHWGWVASAAPTDLQTLATHWRERMVIEEHGQRSLYRFQDPRVMARSLAYLETHQLSLLLGHFVSVLCWDGEKWRRHENPQPGLTTFIQPAPWLYPEPIPVQSATRLLNLEQWLWENRPQATAEQALHGSVRDWLEESLTLADRWGWHRAEQLELLLNARRGPMRAHPDWQPRPNEAAEEHFRRGYVVFGPNSPARSTV